MPLIIPVQWDHTLVKLEFEHSLVSMSKWESKYKRPFLGKQSPDGMEMLYYYECMLLTPDVDPNMIYAMPPDQMIELVDYINTSQSGSTVPEPLNKSGSSETVSTELIYYWLTMMKIDFWPTETWHISRLMMLVRIMNHKQQPNKKARTKDLERSWAEANERQKAFFNSNG